MPTQQTISQAEWDKMRVGHFSNQWLQGLMNPSEWGRSAEENQLLQKLAADGLLKPVVDGESGQVSYMPSTESGGYSWAREFTKADFDKYNTPKPGFLGAPGFTIGDLEADFQQLGARRNPDGTVSYMSQDGGGGFLSDIASGFGEMWSSLGPVGPIVAAAITGGASGIFDSLAAGGAEAAGGGILGNMAAPAGLAEEMAALGIADVGGAGAAAGATAGSTLGDIGAPTGLAEEVASLGGTMTEAGSVLGPVAPTAVSTPSWLNDLLQQTGEAGVPAGQLEGGFNSAISNAPWWSSLPTELQNVFQSIPGMPGGTGGAASAAGSVLGGGAQGSYQFPWASVIGGLLESYGASQAGDDQRALLQQAIDSDLWRPQQPRYFEPLYDAATKGIGNTAYGQSIASDTMAKMASKGYNFSGKAAHEVAQGLNKGSIGYIDALRPLAMGRGESSAYGQFGPGIANGTQDVMGGLGSVFSSIMRGQQGAGGNTNQSLPDVFKGISL
jgi:hypothetical protein